MLKGAHHQPGLARTSTDTQAPVSRCTPCWGLCGSVCACTPCLSAQIHAAAAHTCTHVYLHTWAPCPHGACSGKGSAPRPLAVCLETCSEDCCARCVCLQANTDKCPVRPQVPLGSCLVSLEGPFRPAPHPHDPSWRCCCRRPTAELAELASHASLRLRSPGGHRGSCCTSRVASSPLLGTPLLSSPLLTPLRTFPGSLSRFIQNRAAFRPERPRTRHQAHQLGSRRSGLCRLLPTHADAGEPCPHSQASPSAVLRTYPKLRSCTRPF